MNLTMTENAQAYIRKIGGTMNQEHFYLRFGLKKSGCSGFAYLFDFTTTPHQEQHCIAIAPDITVFVEQEHADFLNGTVLDYEQQAMGGVMRFLNPNEKASCGCGESVTFTE